MATGTNAFGNNRMLSKERREEEKEDQWGKQAASATGGAKLGESPKANVQGSGGPGGSSGFVNSQSSSSASKNRVKVPSLIEFIDQRDFTGAVCLLEYNKATLEGEGKDEKSENASTDLEWQLWLGYSYFHLGKFEEALAVYRQLLNNDALPRRRNSSNPSIGTSGDASEQQQQQQQQEQQQQSEPSNRKLSLTARLMGSKGKNGPTRDVHCTSEASPPKSSITQDDLHLYIALCLFFLGHFEESRESLMQVGYNSSLKNRLALHLELQEDSLETSSPSTAQLSLGNGSTLSLDNLDDQLCRACLFYLQNQVQEAIDIYKQLLNKDATLFAVNYYLALCYYKLDYYDVSQDLLSIYLKAQPKSIMGINLKACNHYKLYNGKAAELELQSLTESLGGSCPFARELIRHNLVVFRNGESALQVLPDLLPILREARVNLIIYHLRQKQVDQAYQLAVEIESMSHLSTAETIAIAVVNAILGQRDSNPEQMRRSQTLFQKVGGSPSECDTIPGRQAMASCFFLLRQFEDVALYLSSIKSYFYNDDNFNFNYGQAKALTGKWAEAEEAFAAISDPEIRSDPVYLAWMTRTFIMNNKADRAWSIYYGVSAPAEASQASRNGSGQMSLGDTSSSNSQAFALLTLIANDCYNNQLYLDSCKAFDLLERMEFNPEYWEGKRGAAAGHFQKVVQNKEPIDTLHELLRILSRSVTGRTVTTTGQRIHKNPQAEQMASVMKKWMNEHSKD